MSDSAERWSLASICILICVIPIGILARLYEPSLVSLTSDEIASVYFSLNPAQIFLTETHPPLFYLLLAPFSHLFDPYALRTIVALMSLGLIGYGLFLSREILSKNGTTILAVLLLLSPPDIFHARTIRQYSLFIELTLIYLILIQTMRPRWMRLLVGFCLSGLHPLGWIPIFSFSLWTVIREKKLTRIMIADFLIMIPVITWYGAKLIFVGKEAFFSHYHPAGFKYAPVYVDIMNAFAGEHFPRINHYPIPQFSFYLTALFFVAVLIWGMIKVVKKGSSGSFSLVFSLIGVTLIFAALFSMSVVDIWNGRFFLFLIAAIYLMGAQLIGHLKWAPIVIALIFLSNLIIIQPFRPYLSDRELFNYYESVKKMSPNIELVFCGNFFQKWYYVKDKSRDCHSDLELVHNSGKEFVLIDLNGQGVKELNTFTKKLKNSDYFRINYTAVVRGKFINPQTKSE